MSNEYSSFVFHCIPSRAVKYFVFFHSHLKWQTRIIQRINDVFAVQIHHKLNNKQCCFEKIREIDIRRLMSGFTQVVTKTQRQCRESNRTIQLAGYSESHFALCENQWKIFRTTCENSASKCYKLRQNFSMAF